MATSTSHNDTSKEDYLRLAITIHGVVQGVGFRPFVYRLATAMNLHGWISNNAQGVLIEVEGDKESLEKFLTRLERERPVLSVIQSLEYSFLDSVGYSEFVIREVTHPVQRQRLCCRILPRVRIV